NEAQDFRGDGIDLGGWNDIATEWDSAGAGVGVAAGRIVDHRGGDAEVSSSLVGSGQRQPVIVGTMVLDAKIVAKEEGAVTLDRASEGSAEIVIGEMAAGRIEEIAGRQRADAVELVGHTEVRIGSGF